MAALNEPGVLGTPLKEKQLEGDWGGAGWCGKALPLSHRHRVQEGFKQRVTQSDLLL